MTAASIVASRVGAEDPGYPLGTVGTPRVTEAAAPIRLVDLEGGVADEVDTTGSARGRFKLGGRAFFGGEIRGDRIGAFFDAQRFELGATEENGSFDIEGSIRAPWFLLRVDATEEEASWRTAVDGAVRLGNDWEVTLSYFHDPNDSGGGPPSLSEFIDTGRLPERDPPTRRIRSGALGFLYQHTNALELRGAFDAARIRTEAGFELDQREASTALVWNRVPFELDGAFAIRRTGRARRTEAEAEVGAAVRLATRWLATGRTSQTWQPDVERSVRDYRAGLQYFARGYRFARSNVAAEQTLALARRANALGYNERRVYDVDALRAFRERLSISPAQRELADAIDRLYHAQVRTRNVPVLGFEVSHTTRELEGSTTRGYGAFVGVPWPLRWPFAENDRAVEFIRLGVLAERETFDSVGFESNAYTISVDVELDRENIVRFRWLEPGQTPEELALRRERDRRVVVEYVYALGR